MKQVWQKTRFYSCVYGSFLLFLFVFLFMFPGSAHAAPCVEGDAKDAYLFDNPIEYCSLEELLLGLVDRITVVLIPIVVLGIVYVGFRMVWAGREKTADYSKWKKAFSWSLIGLFFVLGAGGTLSVIQNTVNEVVGDEYQVGECVAHGDLGTTFCKNTGRCHNDEEEVAILAIPNGEELDDVVGNCGCNDSSCCKEAGKTGPQCE